MLQFARHAQRRHDSSNLAIATPAREVGVPGKRALAETQQLHHHGKTDDYAIARDFALRDLDTVQHSALANYLAIRRKENIDPIAKQIELAKAAMLVRNLIHTANVRVVALEKGEAHRDPMIAWLRAHVQAVYTKAAELGCYDNAMAMHARVVDDSPMTRSQRTSELENVRAKPTHVAEPKDTTLGEAPARKGAPPKHGNTVVARRRIARGSGSVPAVKVAPTAGAPTDARPTARVRPGFHAV